MCGVLFFFGLGVWGVGGGSSDRFRRWTKGGGREKKTDKEETNRNECVFLTTWTFIHPFFLNE